MDGALPVFPSMDNRGRKHLQRGNKYSALRVYEKLINDTLGAGRQRPNPQKRP